MVQITGNLLDPMGNAIVGADIRIKADTTKTVLYGLTGSNKTGLDGLYDFTLTNGTYLIEVLFNKEYIRAAVVVVDDMTPATLKLETLIMDHAKFIPSTIDS